MYTYIFIRIYMYIPIKSYFHIHMYMYTHVYTFIYIYIYVLVHIAQGDPVEDDVTIEVSHSVVLVEGNYLLLPEVHWDELRHLFDERWFLQVLFIFFVRHAHG